MYVLTNLILAIIWQYIHVSNHYILHIKHTKHYMSIYLNNAGAKEH